MAETIDGKHIKTRVFILVGVPGSGKSTYVQKLKDHYLNHTWCVINQDKLGSRNACIDAMHGALDRGESVIVDRCNTTKSQRKLWIDVANYHTTETITVIQLVTDPEECIARIHFRKNHETITEEMPIEKKRQIVYKFFHDAEQITLDEGISNILIVRG